MTELIKEYKYILENAVDDFMNRDSALLDSNAHEQTISHRIAVYLEKRLEESGYCHFNIDCEYNRNISDVKKLNIFLRSFECCTDNITCKSIKKAIENRGSLAEHQRKHFRPDIIMHTRGNNDYNEIVIEIKKNKQCPFDKMKLEAVTGSNGDYRYKLGAFIYFPDNNPKINWFVGGECINN